MRFGHVILARAPLAAAAFRPATAHPSASPLAAVIEEYAREHDFSGNVPAR